MDWSIAGSVAAVVVPTVGFFGWIIDVRMENRTLRNNETLLAKINGTYVKKEVLEPKLHEIEMIETRVAKVESEIVTLRLFLQRNG